MQHKQQPQLCTRLFSRLRLQRRGCCSSSTSRKTTTTHHYHYLLRGGQEKQAKKGGRRLQATRDTTTGMLALSGETRRGEARCFNQHCYVGGARRSCRVAVVAGHFNQQRLVGVNTAMVLHSGGVKWRGAARCFNIAASARRWCRANASRETRR